MKKFFFLHGLKFLFSFFLFVFVLISFDLQAQTILFQSGFESGNPVFAYDGIQIPFNSTQTPNQGTNHGQINGGCTGGTAGCYDGSIITPILTFYPGCTYTVKVYAKKLTGGGSLTIAKALTASNTAVKGATGSDIIMPSTLVGTSYTLYSGTFTVTSTESKFIGFQMYFAGAGGQAGSQMYIDDIVITKECPQCNNGIQDGDETGIDCGGTVCAGTAPVGGTVSPASLTLTCGGGSFTLTLSGHSGSPQWQASRDGITWYDISGAAGTSFTGSVRNTSYFRVIVTNDGCTPTPAYSNIAIITITGEGNKTWLTTGTNDWGTSSNWNPSGWPGACDNVTIPSGGTQPVITANAACNNLMISPGAVLTNAISSVQYLIIYGDFKNDGIYNDASASTKTTLNGGNPSFIGGSGTFTNGNFTVAPNANYTLSSIIQVSDFEIQASGTFSLSSYYLTVINAWTQTGNFYANSGTLESRGTGNLTPALSDWGTSTLYLNLSTSPLDFFTNDDYYNLRFSNSAGTTTIGTNFTNIRNDFTISSGIVDLQTYTINIKGDFINNSTFTPSTGTVVLNGNQAQNILGLSSTTFNNLTINNTSATGIIVQKECTVNTTLTLTDGILNTDQNSKYLYLPSTAAVVPAGGSASSYVDGFVYKAGNSAFVFPAGDGNIWRRIAIGAPSAISTFGAKYINSAYGNYTVNAPLTDVSQIEYWILNRMIGAGNSVITLYWEDATASGIDNCPDLTIARWNGTSWNEQAATASGSCTGTGSGSITTGAVITGFSPFTFGSKSLLVNPLGMILSSFSVTLTKTDVTCFNACNGTATVSPGGGTPPYTYAWSNGGTASVINSLCPGTYSVTVTDFFSNTGGGSVTITQPSALIITADSVRNSSCTAAADGAMFTTASGGTLPYTFSWTPAGGTDDDTVNVSAQFYSVSVTDNKGCLSATGATVNSNPDPTANAGPDATICKGNTYTLSGTIGGGATGSTWTTSGDGGFDNPAMLNATYAPGTSDISIGNVTLTLTTNDPDGVGPCNAASDAMFLIIQRPTVFFVTNTSDAGAGSLRQAVINANANCGHDTINFNLGAGGPFAISITSALPNLTDNAGVTINGWENGANDGTPNTVPVFSATPGNPMNAVYKVILANGNNIPTGFVLASDSNIIKGLVLMNFGDGTPSANDIAVTISGNKNKILGCYIGIDNMGSVQGGTKTAIGISISGGNNQIGNGTAAGANLISGMNGALYGVQITGTGATGNSVKGNMIGLQRDGSTMVSGALQGYGVFITNTATSDTIGGSNAGEGNVISGQKLSGADGRGIVIMTTAGGNSVLGNIVGPQADGVSWVNSNVQRFGILIDNSPNNIIGGNTADARNIVSANEQFGVYITGAGSTGNSVKGNFIGTDKNGISFITGSTQDAGVYIFPTAGGGNTIGGNGAGESNVISGNKDGTATGKGIFLGSSVATGNSILGNIIGPQADGITYLASNAQSYGVYINNSLNNVIGGNSPGARNIISANETSGVYISGASSTGNVVQGNYIGIDITGAAFITGSTQDYGVLIQSSAIYNTIGGSNAGEGNVISGNKLNISTGIGVYLNTSTAGGNTVIGNIIGPQADGISYVSSNPQITGITVLNSPDNIIGGNSAGQRNIVSGNETNGIYISGLSSTGNVVKGNYIGVDKTGTAVITGSTQDYGVYITSSAASNAIGGSGAGEGNVISGNTNTGIYTNSSATAGNVVLGNIIGPRADGVTYLVSNTQFRGIEINASPNNIIGGNTAAERNVISANNWHGVYITGAASAGNIIKGNYIGIDKNGTSFITGSTQEVGVYITASAQSNTIGGSGTGEGNVISGQSFQGVESEGVLLQNTGATGNSVLGNIIGPQADGVSYVASNAQYFGIVIASSSNNIIGGNTAGARNIISANENAGVGILSGSAGNSVTGNYIGASSSMTNIAGSNQDYGIYIDNGSAGNTIGTTASGEADNITFNTVNGIYLFGATTINNIISRNPIYSNTGKPIELNYGANQANNGKTAPVISTANATSVTGTSGANDTIEVFKNITADCFDAVSFVGQTTADGSGNWSLTGLSLIAGDYVLATASDASNNTSEFSGCAAVVVCTNSTNPAGASATVNPVSCPGGTTDLSVAGGGLGSGASWKWYTGSCGGTLTGSGNPLTVNPSLTTTYYVRAEGTCNTTACQSVTVTVTNTNSTDPLSISASSNPICSGNVTTLSVVGGLPGTGASWKWYSGSCGGTFEGTGSSLAVSPAVTITYYVRAEGTCNTTACVSVTVTVNTNPTPTITAGGPTTFCAGGSVVLTSSIASSYSWSTTETTQNITVSAGGTYTVTVTDGNGCTGTGNEAVTVDSPPTTASAGSDQNICNVTTTTLAGNIPAVGTGNWSLVMGTATITTPSAPASGVTGLLISAQATLRWTISNGSCPNSTDDVIINVDAPPTIANAGTDQNICMVTTATLAGNTPGAGAGTWTVVSGTATITSPSSPTSGITGLVFTDTATLRWTISNGSCPVSTDDVVIIPEGPATFTVSNTADAGTGSFRQAIVNANANCGHDTIIFSISGAGPFTIPLLTALPDLTDNAGVTIDGFSQSGASANTVPVFSAAAGTPMNAVYKVILGNNNNVPTGLILASDSNKIIGLVLQDFGDGTVSSNDVAITVSGNNNKILGCYIGMDVTGTTKGIKTGIGISVLGANNQTGNGTAAGANLISGMNGSLNGIQILSSTGGNTVKGNIIGLQKDGSSVVSGASQIYGVYLTSAGSANTIGGGNPGEGNVISGNNTAGIIIANSTSTNIVIGNIIGTQANGTTAVTSNPQMYGVYILAASNNIIGGSNSGERNIISANTIGGVAIQNIASTGNVIKGNYIGTDISGTSFIANSSQDFGVDISSAAINNIVGGTGAGESNLISGNTNSGIRLGTAGATGNTVIGNIIGPQVNGTSYLASNQQQYGVNIASSSNNIIGGNSSGARNIISANENSGILITGAASTGNVVKGNYIGIAQNGISYITGSTQDYGIYLTSGANANTIGGSGTGEGNVISGNKGAANGYGIFLIISTTSGNFILGNIIGPQADGATYLSSNAQTYGVFVFNSPNNIIGGNTSGARNIISANETAGIYFTGLSATGNRVKGNYIGIAQNGTSYITGSTQDNGVYIGASAASDTIGGSGAGEGNVISGNTNIGIYINSTAAAGNAIKGNIIGPQADGISYLTSSIQNSGIYLDDANNTIIGGSGANERNIISGNETNGVFIFGFSGASGNIVKGNYIGPGASLLNITGSNQDQGVHINTNAVNSIIGGSAAGEANIIAFNASAGVYLFDAGAIGNLISRNPIYSNTGKAINLNYGANQGNNGIPPPAITVANTTLVSGTSGAGNIVEVFENTTGNVQDAVLYVGMDTADGSGNWSLPVSLSPSNYVVATARDAGNNTSELSLLAAVVCAVTASETHTGVSCNGGNNGSIDITVGGGTPPFTFVWNDAASSEDRTALVAGTYSITVTDAFSCTATQSVTVMQPATAVSVTETHIDVLCNGGNTGSIDITAAGGIFPYAFAWGDGPVTEDRTALIAGTFNLTVSDSNGCTATKSVAITQPPAISLSATANNSTCGNSDGDATVTANGGTPPYAFSWSGGQTTQTATALASGTYSVTVTDSLQCKMQATASVSDIGGPTVSLSFTPASCYGDSNGTATAAVSGGTPPYTFLWDPVAFGQTVSTATGLTAGTYGVSVSDGNGCLTVQTQTVTEPLPVSYASVFTGLICFGTSDGVVDLQPSSPFYSYNWSNGAVTEDISLLPGGAYIVTVTDTNNCFKTDTFFIEESPSFSLVESKTNITCFGASNGTAAVAVTGITGPYTYLWSNAGSGSSILSLVAGTYTVTVSDSLGCSAVSNSITITEPASLSVSVTNTPDTCPGNPCDGTATATAGGGVTPYNFLWNDVSAQNTATALFLCAGNYTVTVTDSNNCSVAGNTSVIELYSVSVNPAGISVSTDSVCAGDSVTLSVTGGVLGNGATWKWYEGGCGVTFIGSGTAIGAAPAVTTSYYVRAEGTCNTTLCATATVTITGSYSITPSGISTSQNNICTGSSVTLNVTGGSLGTGANWQWYSSSCGGSPVGTGNSISVSPATTTDYYVRAEGNCNTTSCANITININSNSLAATGITAIKDSICPGDSTVLAVQGGVLGTAASWKWYSVSCGGTAGGAGSSVTVSPSSAATYYVRAEGQCNTTTCASIDIYINSLSSAPITVNALPPVICQGNGSTLSKLGGSLGDNAVWKWFTDSCGGTPAGAGIPLFVSPSATTAYYLRAEGACNTTSCRQVTVTVNPSYSVGDTVPVCAGDSVLVNGNWYSTPAIISDSLLTVNGCDSIVTTTIIAFPTYLFADSAAICSGDSIFLGGNWQDSAGIYADTFSTVNNCDSIVVTTLILNSVYSTPATAAICSGDSIFLQGAFQTSAGTYYDTLASVNGCDSVISTTLIVNQTYNISDAGVVICSGDSVAVYGAFQSTAGTYYDSLISFNGCDSIHSTVLTVNPDYNFIDAPKAVCTGDSALIYGIFQSTAGTYYDSLLSINGCDSIHSTVLTVNSAVNAYTSVSICNGDSILLGGSYQTIAGNYVDTFTAGAGCDSVVTTTLAVNTLYSTPANAMICPGDSVFLQGAFQTTSGTYYDTLASVNGCDSIIITALAVNPVMTLAASSADATCFGACDGTGDASPSGGTPPYAYSWSNGQSVPSVSGLCAGSLTLSVTDSAGCTVMDSILVSEPPQIILSFILNNTLCYGSDDGSIDLTVPNGTPPYTYAWDNGKTTEDIDSLPAAVYTVSVTDASGCTNVAGAVITEPPALSVTITTANASCGVNDGSATVAAAGGSGSYTYSWSNGDNDSVAAAVGSGSYFITVTDLNGCFIIDTAVVADSGCCTISVTISAADVLCSGDSTGVAAVTVSNGTPPCTYLWSNGDTTFSAWKLPVGTYSVTVTDSVGCTTADTVAITEPQPINATLVSITNVVCPGDTNGAIDITPSGGTTPYTFYWFRYSDSALVGFNEDAGNLKADIYVLRINDDNGCIKDFYPYFISGPAKWSLTANITPAYCTASCNGSADVAASGATPPYSYLWSTGETATAVTGLCPDTLYWLSITDSKGCSILRDSILPSYAPPPAPVVVSPVTYCESDTIDSLKAQPVSTGIILWFVTPPPGGTPVDTGNVYLPSPIPGSNYYYVRELANGCESQTAAIELILNSKPVADAGENSAVCEGDKVQLNATGGVSYAWKPPDGLSDANIENPVAKPADTTVYYVTVTASNNCIAVDSITVFVDFSGNCWHIYNMFSPNGDGQNDVWNIDGIGRYPENKITIYDRFEDKVKVLSNYDNSSVVWSGENKSGDPLPAGTYFYIIDIGETTYSGWVQIIR